MPIKPGIVPKLDVEREMLGFVGDKLREYIEEYSEPPAAIAFVLIGPDRGDAAAVAYSWNPRNENTSRLQTCSTASALLMKRALGL